METINPPRILVCTTFANRHWDEHAAEMIARFDRFWPKEVSLFMELDDKSLFPHLEPVIANHGGGLGTFDDDARFQAFKAKYERLDDPSDYRKQFFRFSHKIFALNDAAEVARQGEYDYLIWLDADVWTDKPVPMEEILKWLPAEGEICSYLGRKDWPHSECGFVAYKGEYGAAFLKALLDENYLTGRGAMEQQSDDSWIFDVERKKWEASGAENIAIGGQNILRFKNLTPDAPGMNVWLNSPLQAYMSHHKGPVAKGELTPAKNPLPRAIPQGKRGDSRPPEGNRPLDIRIKNCLPHEEICANVSDNLALMPRWIPECQPTNETVVFASAGPRLDVDKVGEYYRRGYRVVCVKHSLERLLAAGIVPWACILLDPRVHVENFVQKPDKRVNYFASSMVDPKVLARLLENGCQVWGYHAAVGAGEQQYVAKGTPIVIYGSASAVRGLFVLKALGFSKFILLGYDLCHFEKPDLNERLPDGNKKYLEVNLEQPTWGGGKTSRTFWSEGQLLAQAQEIEKIANDKMLDITAEGDGIVPWMLEHKKRYKQWYKMVYAPTLKRRPRADAVISGYPWRNRILSWIRRCLPTG